jgi:hypothetical protein
MPYRIFLVPLGRLFQVCPPSSLAAIKPRAPTASQWVLSGLAAFSSTQYPAFLGRGRLVQVLPPSSVAMMRPSLPTASQRLLPTWHTPCMCWEYALGTKLQDRPSSVERVMVP